MRPVHCSANHCQTRTSSANAGVRAHTLLLLLCLPQDHQCPGAEPGLPDQGSVHTFKLCKLQLPRSLRPSRPTWIEGRVLSLFTIISTATLCYHCSAGHPGDRPPPAEMRHPVGQWPILWAVLCEKKMLCFYIVQNKKLSYEHRTPPPQPLLCGKAATQSL